MVFYQKFVASFVLALVLHLILLGLFGVSFVSVPEPETVTQQHAVPEIIQASILDDEIVIQEAQRLQQAEISKVQAQEAKQLALDNALKQQQQQLAEAKKQRLQEEKKAQQLVEKRKQLAKKEQQERERIHKLRVEEAARLAKIKKQQAADEKKRQEEEKREQARVAEQQRQQQIIAAQAVEKQRQQAALLKQQAAAAQAKIVANKKLVISSTQAIQLKVNNSWIKPISATKGMKCTIRVKLLPSGDVMETKIVSSSGDMIFDRSAENAVRKASPLPVPKDRGLFAEKFRSFTFVFKPE